MSGGLRLGGEGKFSCGKRTNSIKNGREGGELVFGRQREKSHMVSENRTETERMRFHTGLRDRPDPGISEGMRSKGERTYQKEGE